MLHYLLLFCLIKNYIEPLSEEITGAVFKSKIEQLVIVRRNQ